MGPLVRGRAAIWLAQCCAQPCHVGQRGMAGHNIGPTKWTINEGIHEEYGFDKKIEQLKKQNKWKEIKFFKSDYIASKDVNAWLGLYQVIK